MKIIETYGNYIEKWSNEDPDRARWLLKTGWKAQNLKFRFAPDKRLMPADRYLARLMMDTMLMPLEKPQESAIVSIFTPCELLQEAGIHPYNVEGFSCYLSASKAERAFLQQAENTGISETLCSYHKTFIGAAQKKVLPKPKCIVYTNLTCDANLLTFKKLAKMYEVPIFAIDVPMQQNEDNVQYVADQLRKLKEFIEKCTGKKITDEALTERLRRSKRTLEKFAQYEKESADKYVPADLVTPLYVGMTNNLLLGTKEEEDYVDRLLKDVKNAPAKKGKMDARIRRHLFDLPEYHEESTVFVYISKSIEVDTFSIVKRALADGKLVASPRCVPGTIEMEFYYIRSLDDLEEGTFGVLEPKHKQCKLVTDLSHGFCIVPGLCFDAKGYRLGYGKGYYDRFLSEFKGVTVGICYTSCVQYGLPHGYFDRPVDILVTENYIRRTEKKQ